jgi:hypothetical protein
MSIWLCATCGIEFEAQLPAECPVCADDRQYLPKGGQIWITLDALQATRSATVRELEPDLYAITVTPSVGIGHRGLLVRTPHGNLLFDPPGYLDDALIETLRELGGIAAIASSHPHLTGVSISLSHIFGTVPVWVNGDNQRWVMRPDPAITFWLDAAEPLPGVHLVQCGGHFAGSAVLHWHAGADGLGVILTGDTISDNADRATVTFLRSFPNRIPLSARSVRKIVAAVEPYAFDRLYSGFEPGIIETGAKDAIRFSADRYIGWITDAIRDPDERV